MFICLVRTKQVSLILKINENKLLNVFVYKVFIIYLLYNNLKQNIMNGITLTTGEYDRLALLFYAIEGGFEDGTLEFKNPYTQIRIQSLIYEISKDKVAL